MTLFDLFFILNSANLICRGTKSSKISEFLGLRDNESRLYSTLINDSLTRAAKALIRLRGSAPSLSANAHKITLSIVLAFHIWNLVCLFSFSISLIFPFSEFFLFVSQTSVCNITESCWDKTVPYRESYVISCERWLRGVYEESECPEDQPLACGIFRYCRQDEQQMVTSHFVYVFYSHFVYSSSEGNSHFV